MSIADADIPGRGSLIACTNCARLKVRCDRQVPCTLCTSKGIECQPRRSRRADTSASRSENRRRNTNSSRSTTTQKRPYAPSRSITSPVKEHDSMFGLFNAYDIDFSTSVLPSGSSTSSSNNGQPFNLPNSRQSSTTGTDDSLLADMLLEGPYFDPTITSISGADFESYPAWDPMQMDDHFLDASLPLSVEMNQDFSTDLTPMPTHQTSRYRRASSEKAAGFKASSIHHVDSVIDMAHSSPHTRAHSPVQPITIHNLTADRTRPKTVTFQNLYDDDIVALVQDSWAGFRCNQSRSDLPSFKTTSMHLKGLAEMLHNQDVWDHWPMPAITKLDSNSHSPVACAPVLGQTRDKLSSMFQSMLQTTFHAHGLSHSPSMPPDFGDMPWDQRLGTTRTNSYVVLPPANILEGFLRSYSNRIEHLYPSVCGSEIQPNAMLSSQRTPEIPALLLLLMIAAGATGSGLRDSFYFSNGLTEVCRVNLWQISEHNAELRSDLIVLRCTLLLTVLAAWSGDKCQMDASMGNRAVYLNMLTQSGLLAHQSLMLSLDECRSNTDAAWQQWQNMECRKRLAYSWVAADLELSLLNDAIPLIPITDLNVSLPDDDSLWKATTPGNWLQAIESLTKSKSAAEYMPMPSLCEAFRFFTDSQPINVRQAWSPFCLRLLLHPMHAMVAHARSYLGCIEYGGDGRKPLRTTTGSSMRGHLEEVQTLLHQWWIIARRPGVDERQLCVQSSTNFTLFHLISLNTLSSFTRIESTLREATSVAQLARLLPLCLDDVEEACFHVGQALRHAISLPELVRPLWWPAAIYRIALVAVACSAANKTTQWSMQEGEATTTKSQKRVLINHCLPDDAGIESFRKYRVGSPALLQHDGSVLDLDEPLMVLEEFIAVLSHNLGTSFAHGIRNRLSILHTRWSEFRN